MRGCNRPYLLWFSSYLTFKFWSRDYHVIITSQNFFIWSSKFPFNQPFIWGAIICCSCFGSQVIWLLNFDHVTTRSRDFSKFFKAFPGMCPMGLYQVCSVNWPYMLWFSHNKAPQFVSSSSWWSPESRWNSVDHCEQTKNHRHTKFLVWPDIHQKTYRTIYWA